MSGSGSAGGATRRLAAFVSSARWEDLPSQLRHEAKRSLMNYFACALGGCRDAAVESTASVLARFSGAPSATVIGRGQKLDALNAAFLNALSANVFDFDDTHVRTIIHPTAPVAPALFACAETSRLPGRDLLLAFALGVEVECRIGNAVSPGHYRRGWHITSTCGVFGAAAATAKVLGLSAERTKWALGNASAQAGGLLETLGTMGKSISVGNAARNGLAAAMFAKEGVSGPEAPLEGTYGFLRVTGDAADFSCLTEGLGEHWELSANTYKLYPTGIVLSPVIEACLALQAAHEIDVGEIERVDITA
ncbi:MAG: MmgE/PrpD family protein, partial [Betaproteobacteria bacterium]|nr:MmgE/PrpD family protein [Betaproteobacteria bacterium]